MSTKANAGAGLLAILLLSGCGESTAPAVDRSAANAPVASAQVPADAAALRVRAQDAMRAQRLFAPARDNALEYYLALRQQAPDDASVQAALVDLQPPLVIAVEQAMANAQYAEAQRLLDLLARTDAQAPALPRLRTGLAAAETAARERALAVDAEARKAAEEAEAKLRQAARASAEQLAAARAAEARPATPAPTPVVPAPPRETPAVAPSRVAAAASPSQQADAPKQPAPVQSPPSPSPSPSPPAPVAARADMPKLLRDVAPRYPEGSGSRSRQSGQVQVAFTIGADGDVQSPRVVASDLPNAFERAALAAAARWKFEATGGSHPGLRTVRFDPPGG